MPTENVRTFDNLYGALLEAQRADILPHAEVDDILVKVLLRISLWRKIYYTKWGKPRDDVEINADLDKWPNLPKWESKVDPYFVRKVMKSRILQHKQDITGTFLYHLIYNSDLLSFPFPKLKKLFTADCFYEKHEKSFAKKAREDVERQEVEARSVVQSFVPSFVREGNASKVDDRPKHVFSAQI